MAKARVVTARNRPRIRSAGRPTRRATTPPTTPAASRATNKSRSQRDTMLPAATAPGADDGELAQADVATPAGQDDQRDAHHPPDQAEGQDGVGARARHEGGRRRRRRRPTATRAARTQRTSGSWRSSVGMGRATATSDQDVCASVTPAHLLPPGQEAEEDHERKTRSTAEGTSEFHSTSCSSTPSAAPARKATGSDSMRASTAAARAGSSRVGPARPSGGRTREGRLEDEGQGGEAPGHRPHQGGKAPDGDAEEAGPVVVLGRRPHGHAGVGPVQEPGQDGDHDGDRDQDEDVAAR